MSFNKALKVYKNVRKDRAYALVELAAASDRSMHLGEGGAKAERDAQFAALSKGSSNGTVPDKSANSEFQRSIYGYDCMKEAETYLDARFASNIAVS